MSHSATSRDSNGPAGNGGGVGGSISDACETCSQHKTNSTSREALHKESESKIFNLILFKTYYLGLCCNCRFEKVGRDMLVKLVWLRNNRHHYFTSLFSFLLGGQPEVDSKKNVVMKAHQIGSENKSYDLRSNESNTLDPIYLKVQSLKNIHHLNY